MEFYTKGVTCLFEEITHLFLVIFDMGKSDLQEYTVIKKTVLDCYFLVCNSL